MREEEPLVTGTAGRPPSCSARLMPVGDEAGLKSAFACFPSGVAAVCARLESGPVGMLVSSFTSVSLQPAMASISVMESSQTWSQLRGARRLGISFLACDQHDVCTQFMSRPEDRFAGLDITDTSEGAVLLPDATAWLDCAVRDEVPAGDHMIVLLSIHALHGRPDASPLVFHGSGFHQLTA